MAENEKLITRHNNILVTPSFRTEEEAAKYNTQARDTGVLVVQPGIAEVGDKIKIGSTIYEVVDLDSEVSGIELVLNSREEVTSYAENHNPVVDILKIPQGTTSFNYNIDAYKPSSLKVVNYGTAADTEYGIAADGSLFLGAGESGEKLRAKGILEFAKFKTSTAMLKSFIEGFNLAGTNSLYDYLASVMARFYHQLYFVPNLKDNNVILIKPETLFVHPPSCNLILPNIKSSIAYSRSYKAEPTRLLLNTDPIADIALSSTPISLNTVLFMEEEDTRTYKNGLRLYKTTPIALGDDNDLREVKRPMLNLTKYESKNGINASLVNSGADIYLYITNQKNSNTISEDQSYNETPTPAGDTPVTLNQDHASVGKIMSNLAAYELCRQRFMSRHGSVSMYFNPYIVPGFPLVSVETYTEGMTIFGYATHVAHDLTDRSWTTTVSFTAAHTDDENCPRVFPIVEEEYTDKINDTYQDMLGDTVTALTNTAVPEIIEQYATEDNYMTRSYQKIWRETAALDDYLEHIADGATIMQDNNFVWLKNSDKSAFFNEEIQNKLKEYAGDIMNRHIAHHHDAVR